MVCIYILYWSNLGYTIENVRMTFLFFSCFLDILFFCFYGWWPMLYDLSKLWTYSFASIRISNLWKECSFDLEFACILCFYYLYGAKCTSNPEYILNYPSLLQVKQMLIALLCESEMKVADETIERILDKVSWCANTYIKSWNIFFR